MTEMCDYNLAPDMRWELDHDFHGRAWPRSDDGWACVQIGGVFIHLFAIRVKREGGLQLAWQEELAPDLARLWEINGGTFEASELPGLEGEWVICAHSYGD